MTQSASMTILGPAPGPDDPLGLLRACHRRLEARLDTLVRVFEVYGRREEDRYDQAAGAIGMVIRHMQGAAKLHNEDEEFSLFPRLIEADPTLSGRLLALEAEHETTDELWASLRPVLQELSEGADPEPGLVTRLMPRVEALVQGHRRHFQIEEAEVFQPAERLLSPEALRSIGEEMAARRQLI